MYRTDLRIGEVVKICFLQYSKFFDFFIFIFFVKLHDSETIYTRRLRMKNRAGSYDHTAHLNSPFAHNHNPLHFEEKCVLLLIRELPHLFASESITAAAIIYAKFCLRLKS